MTSTFPQIAKYTPAVLAAHCNHSGLTTEQLRVATLKRVQCELGNILDPQTVDLHPDHREALDDLMLHVRLAIADE